MRWAVEIGRLTLHVSSGSIIRWTAAATLTAHFDCEESSGLESAALLSWMPF